MKRKPSQETLAMAFKQAQDVMNTLEPVFERGDIDEEQFKQAVYLYAQAVLSRARITSLQSVRSKFQ